MPYYPLAAMTACFCQRLSALAAPGACLRTLHVDMNLIPDQLNLKYLDLGNIQ